MNVYPKNTKSTDDNDADTLAAVNQRIDSQQQAEEEMQKIAALKSYRNEQCRNAFIAGKDSFMKSIQPLRDEYEKVSCFLRYFTAIFVQCNE